MRAETARHIYVHVPFCDGKCRYCAFYSEDYAPLRADRWLDALSSEIDMQWSGAERPAPSTVYLGGGTASILNAKQLGRLCALILSKVSVAGLREWTLEAGPGTLTADKVRAAADYGVNRISLGAQSFDDKMLTAIGRRHERLRTRF